MGSSPSGRYSAGGVRKPTIAPLTNSVETTTVILRLPVASIQSTADSVLSRSRSPIPCKALSCRVVGVKRAAAVGNTVMATSIDARIAAEIAMATSESSCPASCCTNATGINTNTVVMVDANTAGHTLLTPSRAACRRALPFLLSSSMLSRTTILLSRVIPIAKAMPASEITFTVRPASSKPTNATMMQIGTPITPIKVVRKERRNRNITPVASKAPRMRFCHTLRTEFSTYCTSSEVLRMLRPAGSSSSAFSRSSSASASRFISMTLEPASLRMARLMAGEPLILE